MLEFLPPHIKEILKRVNLRLLNEIRIRASKPVTISVDGRYHYLSPYGLTDDESAALSLDFNEIEGIVLRATEYSFYSVSEQIASGFITAEGGVRIGLAGEYVMQKGQVVTVKNITSLNIRIPHEIKGCAELVFELCQKNSPSSVLIISPPGLGKTTMLRDLSRLLSKNYKNNILIIDERGEIASSSRDYTFDVGQTVDIIKYSNKLTAFEAATRSMRPDYIITDELASGADIAAVTKAVCSGIKVAASCHLSKVQNLSDKPSFGGILQGKVFDYYVQLCPKTLGEVDFIYDKDLEIIYGRS